MTIRHNTFISYHHDDQNEVESFINTFDEYGDVFITRALGVGEDPDIIDSDDPDYVMSEIRRRFLAGSTVTIVLAGKCTWARRFVDWEIQSSLRSGETVTPNGLLGIVLPSATSQPSAPERLRINLKGSNNELGYARWYWYPQSTDRLSTWIEDAFDGRTSRSRLIENPRDRMKYNLQCS